jgi:hypothetical protein
MAMGSIQFDDVTVYKIQPSALSIHGQLYKRLGPMMPSSVYGDGTAKCLQIWFFDPEEQAKMRAKRTYTGHRTQVMYRTDEGTFRDLHDILLASGNPLLNQYLSIYEDVLQSNINPEQVQVVLDTKPNDNRHPGRFNAPTCTGEVSVLLPDDDKSHISKNAIVTPMRQSNAAENPIRIIPDHMAVHDALLYPLLNPTGQDGWQRNLLSLNSQATKKVSVKQYTRFHIMKRDHNNIDPNDTERTVQTKTTLHLYVGCGRTGNPDELHIYANQDGFDNIRDAHLNPDVSYVQNVVWPELLIPH